MAQESTAMAKAVALSVMVEHKKFDRIDDIIGDSPVIINNFPPLGGDLPYEDSSKEEVIEAIGALSAPVHVVQCDSLPEGVRGFCLFEDNGREVCVGHRFAKPATKICTEDEMDDPMSVMEACIDGEEWNRCDDPKRLRLGFVRLADIDSDDETELMYFRLSAVKGFQGVSDKVKKYCQRNGGE